MPVMLTDPFGQTPSCNTVKNHDTSQPQDSKSGRGPSASDSGGEADPDPQGQTDCQQTPWYDTIGGGGMDPFFGAGGGVGYLDGGYNGDDGGMGVGSPIGYGGGIGSQLDVLALAFTPTSSFQYYATENNEPVLMTGYIYGNSDLLALLGGGGDSEAAVRGLARWKVFQNKKCRDFVNMLLGKMGSKTADDVASKILNDNYDWQAQQPAYAPGAAAEAITPTLVNIYPRGASMNNQDLAATFIHEAIHQVTGMKSDLQILGALNPRILSHLPGNDEAANSMASTLWGGSLMAHCF